MTPRPRWAATGVLLLLLASACGGSSKPKTSLGQTGSNGGAAFDATGKTSVDVTATNFVFTPSTITATPGQVLKLVVHNTTSTPHNISQTAQNINTDLDPGATQTVTLTMPASGRLVFFCEYHQAKGMTGSIGPAGSALPSSSSSPSSGYNPYGGG
jgi:plastocyanin